MCSRQSEEASKFFGERSGSILDRLRGCIVTLGVLFDSLPPSSYHYIMTTASEPRSQRMVIFKAEFDHDCSQKGGVEGFHCVDQ